MKYRQLGKSGLNVSELCLGTMVFGEDSTRAAEETTAVRLIHRFLDAGGNHIDTANLYAEGRSEEIVGKAIKEKGDHSSHRTAISHCEVRPFRTAIGTWWDDSSPCFQDRRKY